MSPKFLDISKTSAYYNVLIFHDVYHLCKFLNFQLLILISIIICLEKIFSCTFLTFKITFRSFLCIVLLLQTKPK